jgi:polyisoprenoid-binding protein YceI
MKSLWSYLSPYKTPMFAAICMILILPFATQTAYAQAQAKLVPMGSDISFVSRQMGANVEGKFPKFDSQVSFDPKKPQEAKVAFTIDLAAVDIGSAETRAELRKPGWFDSARMPTASFASTSVKALGGNKFEVAGNLTIKGQSKPVTVPISLTQQGVAAGQTRADGSFVIKRMDYKIGDGDWGDVSLVANEVNVKVRLLFTGIAAL